MIIIEFVYSLMAPSCCRQKKFHLNVKTKLIGAGVRDSCGKSASKGDPAGAGAEEAPGPPAESECLEWKSKTVGNSLLSHSVRCRNGTFFFAIWEDLQ
ncbi:hypothetical protein FC682_02380 [Peribacillus simplex]|nr:hypothetical protein FC682_02380 [Peribacillus simplex]